MEISLFMFEQLQTKIKYLEAREWKLYDGHDKRGKFRRGFYMGAAMALRNRLTEMYYKIKEGQYEGVDGQACTALVLMKEDKTESKVNSEFPRLILGKVRKSNGSDGVGIGYARGKAMEINKGVSNHSHKQLN